MKGKLPRRATITLPNRVRSLLSNAPSHELGSGSTPRSARLRESVLADKVGQTFELLPHS